MLVAGEPSGDTLAAELVQALRDSPGIATLPFPPEFFGAGGPKMAAAGVDLVLDLAQHAVFGLSDVLRHYSKFKGFFKQLLELALECEPDVIILVDYAGFNRRFAIAIKHYVRTRFGPFNNWNPKIVYYVSPQVWASRESRAYQLARDIDLLLSIFPFEKDWYAARVPNLRVEFVGHPIMDRFSGGARGVRRAELPMATDGTQTTERASRITRSDPPASTPLVLLLPGSRKREVQAHLPIMAQALETIRSHQRVRPRLILPSSDLVEVALSSIRPIADLEVRTSKLAESLSQAHLAIASSGTITLECAYFGVPTVVLYKTSWLTYLVAKQIIQIRHIAMPNLLADETLYPEFIQSAATADNIASESLDLLRNAPRRQRMKAKLSTVIASLGGPGASQRAADAILSIL